MLEDIKREVILIVEQRGTQYEKSKRRRFICLFCFSLLAMSSKPNDGYNTDFGPDVTYIDDYDVSGKSSNG